MKSVKSVIVLDYNFFFSSRRRHTRLQGDWSSDVCSSDLMLTNEGNAYLKLHKNTEAVAAFTKAASMDPNPGVAYFNLCATQYNAGNSEGALADRKSVV